MGSISTASIEGSWLDGNPAHNSACKRLVEEALSNAGHYLNVRERSLSSMGSDSEGYFELKRYLNSKCIRMDAVVVATSFHICEEQEFSLCLVHHPACPYPMTERAANAIGGPICAQVEAESALGDTVAAGVKIFAGRNARLALSRLERRVSSQRFRENYFRGFMPEAAAVAAQINQRRRLSDQLQKELHELSDRVRDVSAAPKLLRQLHHAEQRTTEELLAVDTEIAELNRTLSDLRRSYKKRAFLYWMTIRIERLEIWRIRE